MKIGTLIFRHLFLFFRLSCYVSNLAVYFCFKTSLGLLSRVFGGFKLCDSAGEFVFNT